MAIPLYSPDIEQSFLGLLIGYPDIWPEVNMVTRNDFAPIRRHIFDTIKGQLDAVPAQPVNPVILVEKLKSYGLSKVDEGGVDLLMYITGLSDRGRMLRKEEAGGFLRELKLMTVKREYHAVFKGVGDQIDNAKSFAEVVKATDGALSSVTSEYFKAGETVNLFAGMIDKIEDEGNHPEKKPKGLMGPFASFNEIFGPLIYPGSMVLTGARSGIGKSSLAWQYTSHVMEKSDIPVLILDAAEMTPEEIQYRAVCCFSEGLVPYSAMENWEWRKNKEWTRLIRDEIWPRVRKMEKTGIYYHNIGGMSGPEIISFVRRFYFNKVGRDRTLLINLDYIKGMESMSRNSSEFQAIGSYVMDLKTLITQDIKASIWTSVQNNRDGIARDEPGKVIEEHDGQLGLSDRIIQQCTHGFIMRFKTVKELAAEKGAFGNIKLAVIKKRRVSGVRAQEILRPVKTATGFRNNYFNLDTQGFAYKDMGTFGDMIKRLGHVNVDLSTQRDDEVLP
jgi:replicative DNA helicase